MKRKRWNHSPEFKAQVALEAIRGIKPCSLHGPSALSCASSRRYTIRIAKDASGYVVNHVKYDDFRCRYPYVGCGEDSDEYWEVWHIDGPVAGADKKNDNLAFAVDGTDMIGSHTRTGTLSFYKDPNPAFENYLNSCHDYSHGQPSPVERGAKHGDSQKICENPPPVDPDAIDPHTRTMILGYNCCSTHEPKKPMCVELTCSTFDYEKNEDGYHTWKCPEGCTR